MVRILFMNLIRASLFMNYSFLHIHLKCNFFLGLNTLWTYISIRISYSQLIHLISKVTFPVHTFIQWNVYISQEWTVCPFNAFIVSAVYFVFSPFFFLFSLSFSLHQAKGYSVCTLYSICSMKIKHRTQRYFGVIPVIPSTNQS